MEPRELWERHAVLAQAFCSSDDEVRRTQGLLDEAEARRSRTLAAFAVTVGSDAVVADLLGLDEREVRLARRTVGKDDARAVAKSLLAEQTPAREQTTVREPSPAQPAAAPTVTRPAPAPAATDRPAADRPAPTGATPGSTAGQTGASPVTHDPAWAPALDAVLMTSWHTGVDLTALATELGLDVRLLVARAQQLSTETRPAPPAPPDRTGRHRRMATLQPSSPTDTGPTAWRERADRPAWDQYEHDTWKQQPYQQYQSYATAHPHHAQYTASATSTGYHQYATHQQQNHHSHQAHQHPHDTQTTQTVQTLQNGQHLQHGHEHYAGYQDVQEYPGYEPPPAPSAPPTWDANAITAAQHDWDGILSQWEATTPTTPPLSAPGHGAT
ncbi:hypothetical protein [Streptomyces sp. NRRL S-337]|uniref:hypothetical protein n=1 Tax=Streptomyces sp. NRRL S-337 TaxID=1463900 RepID=UPI00131ECDDD|nr:hypothetical protein [Streptomyces sp. NRRL S-337]